MAACQRAFTEARDLISVKRYDDAVQAIEGALNEGAEWIRNEDKRQLMFLKGTCLGNTGKHDEALQLADLMVTEFPNACEGFYLRGMSLRAQSSLDDAAVAFAEGVKLDRAEHKSAKTAASDRVESLMRASKADQYRRAMEAHAKAYKTYPDVSCQKCDTKFATPTPEWYCSTCFPQHMVRTWEPDVASSKCHRCDASIGKMSRHHCRCCGRLVCGDCSNVTMAVPVLNFKTPVRVCLTCFEVRKQRSQRRDVSPEPVRESTQYPMLHSTLGLKELPEGQEANREDIVAESPGRREGSMDSTTATVDTESPAPESETAAEPSSE